MITVVEYPAYVALNGKTRQHFRLSRDGRTFGPSFTDRDRAEAKADRLNEVEEFAPAPLGQYVHPVDAGLKADDWV